jgi:integrase
MANRIRGKREGSISQRSNERWRAQVSQDDGRRISHDFKTKPEAQLWLHQMQRDLEQGFDYQGSKTLLKDYLYDWLITCRIALRPKTAYDYEMIVQKHVLPHLGDVTLKELTPSRVEMYYAGLIKAGIGVRTVRLVHSILHRALEKAVVHGFLTRNPTTHATLPRYKHGEMMVWDEIQVNQFLVAAIGSPFEGLYHVAVKVGLRQGELLGLKWSDLQWGSGRLYIRRQLQDVRGEGRIFQEPKTRSGLRTIQLGEGTLHVLRAHLEHQKLQKAAISQRWKDFDLIFPSSIGTPLDPSNLRLDFKRVIERAGIPKVRFHDLRHTAASLMLNNGIPVIVVSKILGHSKPSVTLDIYGHLYNEMQGEASRLMDELVSPVKVNLASKIVQETASSKM